jgi:hypothetical protein
MSLVKQAIIQELNALIPKSKHYASELESAKTQIKRNLMRKRLRANNEKVADLIVALEKINKNERKDTPNGQDSSKG